MKEVNETHRIWHKFSGYLERAFGRDLSEWKYLDLGDGKKIKYKELNEFELSKRLVGYEVMTKIERWIKRYCPEIKIVHCDDDVYAGSDILLIPHPKHGISIMFIPQCTEIQNRFFLYGNHYGGLVKALIEMRGVYTDALDQPKLEFKITNNQTIQ